MAGRKPNVAIIKIFAFITSYMIQKGCHNTKWLIISGGSESECPLSDSRVSGYGQCGAREGGQESAGGRRWRFSVGLPKFFPDDGKGCPGGSGRPGKGRMRGGVWLVGFCRERWKAAGSCLASDERTGGCFSGNEEGGAVRCCGSAALLFVGCLRRSREPGLLIFVCYCGQVKVSAFSAFSSSSLAQALVVPS